MISTETLIMAAQEQQRLGSTGKDRTQEADCAKFPLSPAQDSRIQNSDRQSIHGAT